MRTLILDIETRPSLAYVWGLWDQNVGINQIDTVGTVISFAAKWHGERTVYFWSDFHHGHTEMVKEAWRLIDEADAVVHYNGKAFDIKHLNREFVMAGLGPPSPHVDIDLLSAVKRRFKFASNKLQFVAEQLNVGSKLQHDGFDLWLRCMNNDEKAWATMRRYNKQDVVLTEQVFDILLPWLPNFPNRTVIDGKHDACPRCLSDSYHRRGFKNTNAGRFPQYQCNSCKSYFRGARSCGNTSTIRA